MTPNTYAMRQFCILHATKDVTLKTKKNKKRKARERERYFNENLKTRKSKQLRRNESCEAMTARHTMHTSSSRMFSTQRMRNVAKDMAVLVNHKARQFVQRFGRHLTFGHISVHLMLVVVQRVVEIPARARGLGSFSYRIRGWE